MCLITYRIIRFKSWSWAWWFEKLLITDLALYRLELCIYNFKIGKIEDFWTKFWYFWKIFLLGAASLIEVKILKIKDRTHQTRKESKFYKIINITNFFDRSNIQHPSIAINPSINSHFKSNSVSFKIIKNSSA